MSLIGPRPLRVHYLPLYSKEQHRRHEVRPGISGWAQCHGRNNISWTEKFKLDVWYVDHCSFWIDLVIVFNVVGGAPFYREGSDLYCPIDLTLLEAWDGCEKTVYLPDGVPVRVKIPKGSKEGTEIRVSGRGFSRRFEQDSFFGQPKTGNGDFVLKVKYKVPSKITKEQHKLLEKFYELGS